LKVRPHLRGWESLKRLSGPVRMRELDTMFITEVDIEKKTKKKQKEKIGFF
jgi:hypothetical protein